MNYKNQERDELTDLVGADNWQMVVDEFGGMQENEILAELDKLFPADFNEPLSARLSAELN